METFSAQKQMSRKMLKLIFRFESIKSVYWRIFTIKSIGSNSRLFGLVNLLDLGDKTDDVRKNKTKKTRKTNYYFTFLIGQHQVLQNYGFHFLDTQVTCVLQCVFFIELTSGDTRISDPSAIIRVICFVQTLLNVQKTSITYQK